MYIFVYVSLLPNKILFKPRRRGQGHDGNVPLLPSTGIFVSRIHTEIILREGLEFNKKKVIRLVSENLPDPRRS